MLVLKIESSTYITRHVKISNTIELLFSLSFISMIFKIVSHTIFSYNHIVAIDRVIGTKNVNYSHKMFKYVERPKQHVLGCCMCN